MLNVPCALKDRLHATQNRIPVVVPQILELILVKECRREIGLRIQIYGNRRIANPREDVREVIDQRRRSAKAANSGKPIG